MDAVYSVLTMPQFILLLKYSVIRFKLTSGVKRHTEGLVRNYILVISVVVTSLVIDYNCFKAHRLIVMALRASMPPNFEYALKLARMLENQFRIMTQQILLWSHFYIGVPK
jgi:hypothetical protein